MADQSLESIQYNESEKHFPGTETIDNTWEHSDLRNWLNSSFYNDAFDNSEKVDIIETNVTASFDILDLILASDGWNASVGGEDDEWDEIESNGGYDTSYM